MKNKKPEPFDWPDKYKINEKDLTSEKDKCDFCNGTGRHVCPDVGWPALLIPCTKKGCPFVTDQIRAEFPGGQAYGLKPAQAAQGREWTKFGISGDWATVDTEDIPVLSRFTWHVTANRKTKYAYTNVKIGGKQTSVSMHRLLCGLPSAQIDHINRDGLDNRKANLRFCTLAENQRNRVRHNPHGYRGVFKTNNSQFYGAQIMINGKRHSKKGFKTPIEAARAYDEMSKEHHGEFGIRNFKD